MKERVKYVNQITSKEIAQIYVKQKEQRRVTDFTEMGGKCLIKHMSQDMRFPTMWDV